MALTKVFGELSSQGRKLRDSLLALQLTIREDLPLEGSVALIDQFGDAVDDSLGWLEESLGALGEARRALEPPVDLDRARRSLTICQEQFHRVEERFASDLISYEKLKELVSFGRGKRGEWAGWVKSVRIGIEQSREAMDETSRALLACWQEIAERAATTSVSIKTTSVGQQIGSAYRARPGYGSRGNRINSGGK